ncbi:squalene synthase HpnC [Roseateles terrae]|uniref:Squalene synthase HpnC n=1 Tax=Roseateles terrae TaxID=431060 RepID=A0ABR6GXH9_9BURK|nr:squalene synthase HpnC [Roseateles terrae]MBB3196407.1 squalene synthase HpnC [Roseateles terrae]OWQ83275.1 squalene synthase HpnC [Roseateles terrae]
MSIEHYENFPVASWLCPPALRPPITAIYHFARTADDLADEGNATAAERLADLAAFRADLRAVAAGQAPSPRWERTVFRALGVALVEHRLPVALLEDLLDAFEQDLVKQSYADRAELLDYCRRSANPVGRLLLHLYGLNDPVALARSDAICSALQLINFWQDFTIDGPRGRVYAPETDLQRHGLQGQQLLALQDSPAARALIADLCGWARALMLEGAPLVFQLPGRAGWELRLVVQGGLRILQKLEAMHFAALVQRPRLRASDAPALLWAALRMRAPEPQARSRHPEITP